MLVIIGDMIDYARPAAMRLCPAKLFRRDLLTRRRLHQRRTGKEDRALVADDHRLVRHRRNIGPARRAASHHAGDLRNALGRHLRLIVENPPRSEEHTSELQSLMRISYA